MNATLKMQAAGDEPRILVIQSNRNYLGVVVRRLKEFGYRVAAAETAQTGLAEMYRVPVDLVLCDVNLPETSGIEFARMVREDPVNRDIPLLLFVGRSDPAAAVNAFAAGADGVIRKPCHFEVLDACIARQLDRADAVKRLVNDNATLDARVVERAIQIGELRDELALVRATAVR
jgi:two-component system, OmpR family, phosphate regulon response regulator PhoB